MKLDFNGAVGNALMEQKAIREFLEKIETGDFGDEIRFYAEMKDLWNGESAFLLGELSEKISIVAEELRKGNSEIVKEFFDFLCIDISKKESGKK